MASTSSTMNAESKKTCESQTRSHGSRRAASMKPSPKTFFSHLRSASAAESLQYRACASSVASGHGWWLCAAKCSRPGLAAWNLEKCFPSTSRLVLDRLDIHPQNDIVGEIRNVLR